MSGLDQFNKTIEELKDSFTAEQLAEIKTMNDTLYQAVYETKSTWQSDGGVDYNMFLCDTPAYRKSLLLAYTLFKKYKYVFYNVTTVKTVKTVKKRKIEQEFDVRCMIMDNRIIFKFQQEVARLFTSPLPLELTFHEYLQKYTTDAIFYFEELNREYKYERLGAFIPENQLSAPEQEPPALTQLDADYTAFWHTALAHTDDILLPQPPEKGWFDAAKDIFVTSAKHNIPGLLEPYEYDTKLIEVFGKWPNFVVSLDNIRLKYKEYLEMYKPEIIKAKVLALGIPRLFDTYYATTVKKIHKMQPEYDALILYIENAEENRILAIKKHQIERPDLYHKPYGGGSKKYISRRKYKRTSTKTKRIRKLI
jgi:hypothetical protein